MLSIMSSVYGIESGLTATYAVDDVAGTAELSDTLENFVAGDVVIHLTEDGMENLFVANTVDGATTSITISDLAVRDYIFKALTFTVDATNLVGPDVAPTLGIPPLQEIASDFNDLSGVHLNKLKYSIVGRTLDHASLTAFKAATAQYALKDAVVTSLEGFGFFNNVDTEVRSIQILPAAASNITLAGEAANLYSALADAKLIDLNGNVDLSGSGFGVNVAMTLGFRITTQVDFSADTSGDNVRVGKLAGTSVTETTLIDDDKSSATTDGTADPPTTLKILADGKGVTDSVITFNLLLDYTPAE